MSYLVLQDDWSAARRGDKATNLVTGMSGLIGATALVASVCMNSAAREILREATLPDYTASCTPR